MANKLDVAQWQENLTDACKFGEVERARTLIAEPGTRKVRALLEDMLAREDVLVRQAAVFGLGELGGAASARRLEQQLAREEARGDYDGDAVAEAITETLGRLKEAGTRAMLVRRLERLAASNGDLADINSVAHALWTKRHPALLPPVRKALELLGPSAVSSSLYGLLLLLEKSPEELSAWALDPSVPVKHKTEVVTVLHDEVPDTLVPAVSSFISAASALVEPASNRNSEASYYCEFLFRLLIHQREQVLPGLPHASRAELHTLVRSLVPSRDISCSYHAGVLLQFVGGTEDVALLEAHRPEDPILAKVFDEAAQTLRNLHGH
jgi:hypothetical protein